MPQLGPNTVPIWMSTGTVDPIMKVGRAGSHHLQRRCGADQPVQCLDRLTRDRKVAHAPTCNVPAYSAYRCQSKLEIIMVIVATDCVLYGQGSVAQGQCSA